jgi:hypothetical protein
MTWKSLRYGCLVALVPALVACDPAPQQDEADRAAAPDVSGSAPASFMPIDHSGVTGTAVADRDNDRITISLSLEGLTPDGLYLASVHADRCAADGPLRVPLGRVVGDDDGTARVDLRADIDEMPEDFPWSVQLQSDDGVTVACADVVAL